MSISKHIAHFEQLREEIESAFSDNDKEKAVQKLHSYGKDNWEAWINKHIEDSLKFLSQTPQQRKENPVWEDKDEKLLGILSVLILIRQSVIFARAAKDLLEIADRGTYRGSLLCAAENSFCLPPELSFLWPFEGEDPWGEEVCFGHTPWSMSADILFPHNER